MNQIDVTIQKVCSTCRTETPFRYLGSSLVTLGERSTMELRVDPDEFLLCPTCGNPMRLHIKCQPYELVNHLDTPVARALYEQERRREQEVMKGYTIETKKTNGQFEATVLEIGATVTGATENEAMTEAHRAIMHSMIAEYEKRKRNEMDRSL